MRRIEDVRTSKEKFFTNCVACNKDFETTKSNEKRKKNKFHCASCSISLCWKNENYNLGHRESLKIAHNTESAKLNHSKASLRNFDNKNYKEAALLRINSKESREKARRKNLENWSDPVFAERLLRATHRSKSKKIKTLNGEVEVKSSYEEVLINCLDAEGIKWEYESKCFQLEELNRTYIPDFYLPQFDLWIEVKGYFYPLAKLKWECWRNSFGLKNILLSKREIEMLKIGDAKIEDFIKKECGK